VISAESRENGRQHHGKGRGQIGRVRQCEVSQTDGDGSGTDAER
jgi:hypothetical protein